VFVDPNCVQCWRERIDVTASNVIERVQHIATVGREVDGTGAFPQCRYFAHPDFPTAVVVVKFHGGGDGNGAAVTVLRAEFLESLRSAAGEAA
jgi:hypothetical protein